MAESSRVTAVQGAVFAFRCIQDSLVFKVADLFVCHCCKKVIHSTLID